MAIRSASYLPVIHPGPHDDVMKMRELLLKEGSQFGVTNAYGFGHEDINGEVLVLEGRPTMNIQAVLDFLNRNYEMFEEIL